MKLRFLYIQSSKEVWFSEAQKLYEKKLKSFTSIEIKALKAAALSRDNSVEKKRKESELLLREISDKDFVILFDEAGFAFKNSLEFESQFKKTLESGKQSVTFIVGGAYGSSEELKQRADKVWSLSALTMNHMLASIVALEQIYRAYTIQNNLPYHNS